MAIRGVRQKRYFRKIYFVVQPQLALPVEFHFQFLYVGAPD
ncbi:hypothetical protein B8A10_09685 [Staphylococcus aureus]|nr:hypothetical protein B7437_10765 [Staphylococcus aureus]ORN89716.1 hypothetical protein B8A10_09685 [Staphylococcus aureus]